MAPKNSNKRSAESSDDEHAKKKAAELSPAMAALTGATIQSIDTNAKDELKSHLVFRVLDKRGIPQEIKAMALRDKSIKMRKDDEKNLVNSFYYESGDQWFEKVLKKTIPKEENHDTSTTKNNALRYDVSKEDLSIISAVLETKDKDWICSKHTDNNESKTLEVNVLKLIFKDHSAAVEFTAIKGPLKDEEFKPDLVSLPCSINLTLVKAAAKKVKA